MSISVGGLVSGLDTNGMIEQMLALQQQPITNLQQREAAYQVELTAYGSLKGVLGSIKTAIKALETTDDLTDFSAVSGDADLFTVSADENASSGSYDITIQKLAKVHKLTSGAFTKDELVGEGTIHLKVGSGSTTDITVSATDTIDDVAQSINAADAGVQAAVIFDGTNYFLTLAAEETGAQNVINLTVTDTGDANNTDMNGLSRLVYDKAVTENISNTQDAADAIITVDGVADIHRETNIIDDVIEGVTINLESAPLAPDNQALLTVSRNTATVVSKINTFVEAYNKGLELFESFQGYDSETEVAGIFLGDTTTNNIRNRLENMASDTLSGVGSFSRLSDLGIALNDEGRLEVDYTTLNSALDDNFDDVLQFFSQTTEGSEGFSVLMLDSLDAALDSTDGTLAARTDGIQSSIDGIGEKIERIEMRNLAWESRTRAQFNALELLLSDYQNTGNFLSQQITGLQNLNNYVSNKG